MATMTTSFLLSSIGWGYIPPPVSYVITSLVGKNLYNGRVRIINCLLRPETLTSTSDANPCETMGVWPKCCVSQHAQKTDTDGFGEGPNLTKSLTQNKREITVHEERKLR